MIGNDWDTILKEEFEKKYFKELKIFLDNEYKKKIIFPEYKNIFRALKETEYQNLKIVIIGQDPYHGEKEANGLAFSVNDQVKMPPSLRNIYKELNSDLYIVNESKDLSYWAKQGVLLINAVFTVEKDKPASHKNKGWEIFTDNLIRIINKKNETVIFVLWGNFAKLKKTLIDTKKHKIIESSHPSPFSARKSFFGSKPFSKINKILKEEGNKEIDWQIKNLHK